KKFIRLLLSLDASSLTPVTQHIRTKISAIWPANSIVFDRDFSKKFPIAQGFKNRTSQLTVKINFTRITILKCKLNCVSVQRAARYYLRYFVMCYFVCHCNVTVVKLL